MLVEDAPTVVVPLFDPFPDAGMFGPGGSAEQEATHSRAAREATDREAARQRSLVPPPDVAMVLSLLTRCAEVPLRTASGAPVSDSAGQLARVRALVQAQNALAAELARTVRSAEEAGAAQFDGHKAMTPWLKGHLHFSGAEAAHIVKAGKTLEALPGWAEAARTGRVTPEQTAVVAKTATPARLARAEELGADLHGDDGIDATLVASATGEHAEDLPFVVRRVLEWIDPDGPEPDPTKQREVHLSPSPGGGGSFHGRLDAVAYERFATVLTAFQQAGRVADDDRTHAQQMGDALAQASDVLLASEGVPMLRKHRAQVAATISAEDLLDHEVVADAARLGSGQTVSNEVARQLACDSIITRVLFGPDGTPLNIGRAQRLVPAHIRKAAEARDGGCVFAGCATPTWWCDAHHVREWVADHGETSVENTALLCERHHTQVHHGFSITWNPVEHRWRTCRPDGSEILVGYPLEPLVPRD